MGPPVRRVDERVIVVAPSFIGKRGVVTQVTPLLMVQIDGERLPLHFGEREVIAERESARHMTAGE